MKLLNETLTWHVASQVQELKVSNKLLYSMDQPTNYFCFIFFRNCKKLVAANRDVLLALRTNFDKPDVMKTEFKKLQRKY